MDTDFWQQSWKKERIGFHEGRVNRHLEQHWHRLKATGDDTVFVPLCGKAVDLAWLHQQGHRILGVELSELACRAFFSERGIQPTVTETGAFVHFSHDRIDLLCGDFFKLESGHLQGAGLFYDRAAMIALPPQLRPRYCSHLAEILGLDARGLLITLDYPAQAFSGPPFAVSEVEVREHLGLRFAIERLHTGPMHPREALIERGLDKATESVFRLSKPD